MILIKTLVTETNAKDDGNAAVGFHQHQPNYHPVFLRRTPPFPYSFIDFGSSHNRSARSTAIIRSSSSSSTGATINNTDDSHPRRKQRQGRLSTSSSSTSSAVDSLRSDMACLARRLLRRKQIDEENIEKTDLARCLTTLDLTALGVGSTLGAGAYVIAGTVARTEAGPAVIISFFIAAIASVLAGLCYAEFGARVPKAGSAYIYTYVSVGEFLAFVIGWNLILEYVIGTASVARTFSGYFDDLVGDRIIPFFNATMPMHVNTLAPYCDLLAFGITMLVTVILAVGVKESALFTKVFTLLNVIVLTYIIICGAFRDDPANWSLTPDQIPNATLHHCEVMSERALETNPHCCGKSSGCGAGGFIPYGFSGIMRGAATCFFAFVGFDAIATTGEEVQNPQQAIPVAIIISLLIIFVMYSGISVTITMMAPYYVLDSQAPFAKIFGNAGWTISKYIIGVGAICALCTSLLGAMFPMPRVVLAMGRDGLIFRFFQNVHAKLKTPLTATLVTGFLAGVMAAIFDVKSLVDMMSIGTLLAYTLVSVCVLLLRYEFLPSDEDLARNDTKSGRFLYHSLKPKHKYSTPRTAKYVKFLTILFSICLIIMDSVLAFHGEETFQQGSIVGWILFSFSLLGIITSLLLINLQPQSCTELSFAVPLIPWFPAISMFFNIYLMLNLDPLTWARFTVWMFIGFSIYFLYGMWHSTEEMKEREAFRAANLTAVSNGEAPPALENGNSAHKSLE